MPDEDLKEQVRVLQEKVAEQERQRAEDLETLKTAARPRTRREAQAEANRKMRDGRDSRDPDAIRRARRNQATAEDLEGTDGA